ncbi:MAG TPA: M20/M25/M40 family metallo-hydrolase [Stellaceae bacterium]|nr:M20/M25/M40 family metallo-hydrolase [Stellaceae bacterium]
MIDAVLEAGAQDFEKHVERLQRYIRQPSVSAENRGNEEMAAILAQDLEALGGKARVVPGVDFPIVYARFDVGAPCTVLIHSMYDTTPADEEGWVVDPFAATRMDYEGFGDCIVARGTEDTKGPVTIILAMIENHRKAGVPLPVNLILLFEASELGSASMPPFIDAYLDELKDADVAYWPFFTGRADGTAVAWLGCKGLATMKLRCKAGDWGGPVRSEIHGAHNSWVASPPMRLAQALATLKTPDDLDVAIEGFYEGLEPPTEDDRRILAVLTQRLDPKKILDGIDVKRFKQASFADALYAHCFVTDFNVAGLQSGNVFEGGHKASVPSEAVAAIDFRPLEGMSMEKIETAMRRHLDKHGFPEVQVEIQSGYIGARLPITNWAVQELLGAYKDCGFDPEVWPRTATAIAADLFARKVGVPWLATCPGHAARKHSANEYITIAGFRDAIEFITRLMWRLGTAKPGAAKVGA